MNFASIYSVNNKEKKVTYQCNSCTYQVSNKSEVVKIVKIV